MMPGILNGMTLIEGSAFVAAPLGGMTLAQLGADVVRFDMIGGGLDYRRWPADKNGTSLYWASLNKGKKSITIDIRKPEGQELVRDMVEAAGTFLTNFPAKGWLSYDELKKVRKDLVMLNVTGNPDGSSELDYTVNCAAGYPWATGPAGHEGPVNHVLPAWDVSTGLYAAIGLIAADRHRQMTGEGQLVRVALSDVTFATVGNLGHIAEAQINGVDRPRSGNELFGTFGSDFKTADDRHVMVVAVTPKQWSSLIDATGLAEGVAKLENELGYDFKQEGDRYRGRGALIDLFATWISANSFDTVSTAFDINGVCWGPYRTFKELVANDPRVSTANPMFAEVNQPGIGSYLVPGSPLYFGAVEKDAPKEAPLLGQHTDQLLSELLGLSDAQIGVLYDRKIVAGPAK